MSFDNERPIYLQLKEIIKIRIINKTYDLSCKLPSVREFSQEFKVNPNTIQKALQELEDEGLIYTERTNGKYVSYDLKKMNKVKMELADNIIKKFFLNMESLGISKRNVIDYLKERNDEK